MVIQNTYPLRRGHSLIEMTAAIALIVIIGAIVAQTIVWSLRERQRLAMRHAALEIAANVLEEARVLPIDQLNQVWGDAQRIPSEVAGTLPNGKLIVTVEPLKDSPRMKRVTAEVRWQLESQTDPRSVSLATALVGRVAPAKAGEP